MTLVRLTRSTLLAIVSVTGLVGVARAQSAEAEMLFRDGRALIKAGKMAEGCAKFDASARIEPSIGTLLNLGDCRERLGKRASAWAAFRKAEAIAHRDGRDTQREKEAKGRAEALEPTLAKLIVRVDGRVGGETVRRDGETIDPAVFDTAVPIDAGTYAISADAPGFLAWRGTVTIDTTARTQTIQVPALAPAVMPQVPEPTQTVVSTSSTAQPQPLPPTYTTRTHTWSAARGVGTALAIGGLAAIGTGVYFGLKSDDLAGKADERCPLTLCTDSQAVKWTADAKVDARRATALYIGGAVGVLTATILWVAGAPDDETVIVPAISHDQVGVSIQGRL